MLFFDKRLSADNTISCATCHKPENAFSEMTPVSTGSAQEGTFHSPDGIDLVPTLSHWMFFGVDTFEHVVRVPAGERQMLRLQFDAVAQNPGTAIDAAGISNNAFFNFNYADENGIQISATMEHNGQTSSVVLTSGNEFFIFGADTADFDPAQRVAVDSIIAIDGPAEFTSMMFDFRLVPEPPTYAIWFVGLTAVTVLRRRRR